MALIVLSFFIKKKVSVCSNIIEISFIFTKKLNNTRRKINSSVYLMMITPKYSQIKTTRNSPINRLRIIYRQLGMSPFSPVWVQKHTTVNKKTKKHDYFEVNSCIILTTSRCWGLDIWITKEACLITRCHEPGAKLGHWWMVDKQRFVVKHTGMMHKCHLWCFTLRVKWTNSCFVGRALIE